MCVPLLLPPRLDSPVLFFGFFSSFLIFGAPLNFPFHTDFDTGEDILVCIYICIRDAIESRKQEKFFLKWVVVDAI